jgi:glutathione synthase/RimK-type ligase-like ATP-grasp enzyme
MIDIVVLTDKRYIKDSTTDLYKHNVFYEDELVVNALKNEGLNVLRMAWDDPTFNWSDTKFALFRTTWDYFERFDEFSSWLSQVSKQTQLLNSEKIIRWNIDKHYLLDLKRKGIHIAKSYFLEQGEQMSLNEIHEKLNWQETVLKPCISGAARHTYRLNKNNIKDHENVFKQLVANEAMILQPFQENIVKQGEVSLMVIDGKFTHAVLKIAKKGDFRVQDDFGGTVQTYNASLEEIKFAENAVKACIDKPIYARVDVFKDNDGILALSELELIEPELWFRNNPESSNLLAAAIKKFI